MAVVLSGKKWYINTDNIPGCFQTAANTGDCTVHIAVFAGISAEIKIIEKKEKANEKT